MRPVLLSHPFLFLFLSLLRSFSGASAEVQERQECQYGENCTFAYCQEEIDVWTQERKGALSRELLFDPLGTNERRALSVTRLLQLHMGMFMFLCEVRPVCPRPVHMRNLPAPPLCMHTQCDVIMVMGYLMLVCLDSGQSLFRLCSLLDMV